MFTQTYASPPHFYYQNHLSNTNITKTSYVKSKILWARPSYAIVRPLAGRVRLSVTSPQFATLPSGLSTTILRAGSHRPAFLPSSHRPQPDGATVCWVMRSSSPRQLHNGPKCPKWPIKITPSGFNIYSHGPLAESAFWRIEAMPVINHHPQTQQPQRG